MNLNPKDLEKAMKKLGVKQEEIDANEVIIKCNDRELVIKNPKVIKINMMGQESLQINGEIEERSLNNEEDVKTVMEQTKCSRDEAVKALGESEGDIAGAILSVK